MADLHSRYLGFELEHPLVPGASPLADDLDSVRRLQDAGAPLITVRSFLAGPLHPTGGQDDAPVLFAPASQGPEPYSQDQAPWAQQVSHLYAGLHNPPPFAWQENAYCDHLAAIREAVGSDVPIVASLYACELDRWIEGAQWLSASSADALELNVYGLAIRGNHGDDDAREQTLQTVEAVCREATIPVVVKLLPFYAGLDQACSQLADAGAAGFVLFNGFYRSEMGVERLHDAFLHSLISPQDPTMRYYWLSRLYGNVNAELAFSGGARTGLHAVKAVLCGASTVQLVSALLKNGPAYLATLRQELNQWMDEYGYGSLSRLLGRVALSAYNDPDAFDIAYANQILFRPS